MKFSKVKKNNLKHVLIIHAEGNSFNNPSLKCIIDLLLEKGCKIDLRYKSSQLRMPTFDGLRLLPYNKTLRQVKSVIFNVVCIERLVFLAVFLEKLFLYRKNYDLIIGVDRQGLIEASLLSKFTATPYILISFEIMFESETSFRFKSLEKKASEGVSAWLVQDEMRAEKLQFENCLDSTKRYMLPLASAELGHIQTERLRDHLGIPFNKKVAIIIGSMSKWSMVHQIIKTVSDWPKHWVLIVHERYGKTLETLESDCFTIQDIQERKIYFSNATTDMVDDMGAIFAGVSVGLAFYEPDFNNPYTGKNIKYLGLASGKIATYLRYGIPIIVNEIGLYADEAKEFRFGCVVQQPEQIKEKLDEISQDDYRINARDYFSKKLDFNIYKEEVYSLFCHNFPVSLL